MDKPIFFEPDIELYFLGPVYIALQHGKINYRQIIKVLFLFLYF
jgi:hypothetical protein